MAPTEAASLSEPTSHTSPEYGYTITLAAGWTFSRATTSWDGRSDASHDDANVDAFHPPSGSASAWAFAGPFRGTLAAFTKARITANARYHGDTCPPAPEVTGSISIGGRKGSFLAWNCGILINLAITVDRGVGYVFAMRDPGIHASTDPADRAIFESLLDSVHLPG